MSAPPFLNLTAYATRLAELVPDNRPSFTRTDLVREALRLYAQDNPCRQTVDLGDGTTTEWSLSASPFTLWKRGFSEGFPVEVEELSAAATQRPRVELTQGRDFYLEERTVSTVPTLLLVFVDAPPTTQYRVRFARPWQVDDATPTALNEVPEHHQEAVVKRAAAYACQLLATHYLKTVDAALGSDAFSAMDVVNGYREQSRTFLAEYRHALGVGAETPLLTGRCRTGIPRTFPYLYEGEVLSGDA